MTEKLYDLDSYVTACIAEVLSCSKQNDGEYDVILSKTPFFPESGGQPCDQGTIGDAVVLFVCEKNGEVIHTCDRFLEAGVSYPCSIDFPRRFQNMQFHTGEHILSGILKSEYSISNIGFHIGSGSDYFTVDTDREVTEEMANCIEELANRKIYEMIPVTVCYPKQEVLQTLPLRKKPDFAADLRVVAIDGCDICACCGTHVQNTGEVGVIKIVELIKYKSGSRLRVLCGLQAVSDYRNKNRILSELCTLFSSQPDNLKNKIQKTLSEQAEAKMKLAQKTKQLLKFVAAELLEQVTVTNGNIVINYISSDFTPDELKLLSAALLEKAPTCTARLFYKSGENYCYLLSSASGQDMRQLTNAIKARYGGSGGGTASFCQGSINSVSESELLSFLQTN